MGKALTKRQAQAIETKNKIFESACKLFKEKGFDYVSMEDITSAVGLTPGSFYRYFTTKHQILAIVYEQLDNHYQEFYDRVILTEYREAGVIERLKAFISHNLEISVGDGMDFTKVIYPYMRQSEDFTESMINPQRAYYRIVRELFAEGQEKGEIRDDISTDQLVADLVMLTRGCIVDWELHSRSIGIRDWSKSLLDCYFDGVRKSVS